MNFSKEEQLRMIKKSFKSRKSLEKQCDDLWSEIVKLRAGNKCECGNKGSVKATEACLYGLKEGLVKCSCGKMMKEVKNHNIFIKLLIFLGFRCECGGKLKDVYGWPYDECVECGKKYY